MTREPDSEKPAGRLPKLEGIDYKRAALDYPRKLDAERLHYLRTKPFYNLANKPPKFRGEGMDVETHRHFCDFANIAVALELPAGSRILDAACGSGWLSEFFTRLGYDVTGIDISPELIRISQERLERVPYPVDHQLALRARFLVHDIEIAPLAEKFDAIVCYDAMHHFVDEQAVARHFAAMLEMGGMLFILEGNRPPSHSAAERELVCVMKEYHTLESPFDPVYLRQVLEANGFAIVGDYVSINGLIDRAALDQEGRVRIDLPPINYLLCKKVSAGDSSAAIPDSRAPGTLRAEIALVGEWLGRIRPNERFSFHLRLRNAGDTLWLGGRFMRPGAVMLGIKILDATGDLIEEFHGEPVLPRALAPNESREVMVEHAGPAHPGRYEIKIDLVAQHVSWFEPHGSEPLILPLEVG